jgi:phosphopantetheine binding protein
MRFIESLQKVRSGIDGNDSRNGAQKSGAIAESEVLQRRVRGSPYKPATLSTDDRQRDTNELLRAGRTLDAGDSVISQIRTTFGVEIPVRDIFTSPTVKDVSARIEEAILEKISPERINRLLDLQEKGI